MGLEQQLDAVKAGFTPVASAGRVALYQANIEAFGAGIARKRAIQSDDRTPRFTLSDHRGSPLSLATLLEAGPAVVAFYRDGWHPQTNVRIRAYQTILPETTTPGGRLVGISLHPPDASLSTADANELTFDALSELGNGSCEAFGLVCPLPQDPRTASRSTKKGLPDINGEDGRELPVPPTDVIARDGPAGLGAIDVDYRNCLEPEAIPTALNTMRPDRSRRASKRTP